ncbi:MAG: acyltransferase domain-containing protein [Acidobacteria bacterium]|nr:acyltransferase domain-containing protein [Acidobacteriota bacterium]
MSSDGGRGVQDESSVAVIGFAGRFPGALTLEQFWQNLRDGVESITFFTDEELLAEGFAPDLLAHPKCVRAGAILDDIESFDAHFFGFSPREAEITDPQQRLFLECAWEALEHAGYDSQTYPGLIGVYGGVGRNDYLINLYSHPHLVAGAQAQITIGNERDYVTTRVSYKLNLRGPSINVQTACSTSLVAIHFACQSLLNGECHLALAGGLSLNIPQRSGYIYEEGGIISPDGRCRAYDASARGIVGGNGGGVVVLKPLPDALADGDCIHAVIRGSAVNNDGAAKVGFTAPGVDGQAAVIREALAVAGVRPDEVTYVEGHGTGTALGDPIEVSALTQAFRSGTDRKGFCALGSVKTNFGHLDAGAGVAGLLKAVLALKDRVLPPSLHFERPNPNIDFANSPFYVNHALKPWETTKLPRRAGVSSFGIGGTNAHVLLEEAPEPEPREGFRPWHLLPLSAKTPTALEAATANLAAYLRRHPEVELADVAHTLQVGRRGFAHRRAVVCRDHEDAAAALEALSPERVLTGQQDGRERPVVFMFSGQGAQYVNMGLELYQTELYFRQQLDRCAELLMPHLRRDLRSVLYPAAADEAGAAELLRQTEFTQPALFAVEYALARLWQHWGVRPQAMIGHSIGEYVAACLAGVMSLEAALALVAARGRLMQKLPGGSMLSVALPEGEVRPLLGAELSLAAVNDAGSCVVAGPSAQVAALAGRLAEQGTAARPLATSHAFHSSMTEPILEPFGELCKRVELSAPTVPYVSNVTGTWVTAQEATDPAYWRRHLRETVRFADGLRAFAPGRDWVFIEVGPGNTLGTFARRQVGQRLVLTSLRHPREAGSDVAFLQGALGRLWLAGVTVAWPKVNSNARHRRVPLPTYPFERRRYWIERRMETVYAGAAESVARPAPAVADEHSAAAREEPARTVSAAQEASESYPRPSVSSAYVPPGSALEEAIARIWQARLGIGQIGVHDNFFELGGDSLLGTQIAAQLSDTFKIPLPLQNFFQRQTIAGLAEVIETILFDEIASLTEAEAEDLHGRS